MGHLNNCEYSPERLSSCDEVEFRYRVHKIHDIRCAAEAAEASRVSYRCSGAMPVMSNTTSPRLFLVLIPSMKSCEEQLALVVFSRE